MRIGKADSGVVARIRNYAPCPAGCSLPRSALRDVSLSRREEEVRTLPSAYTSSSSYLREELRGRPRALH